MTTGNLALRFVAELLGILALAYAGFQAANDTVVRVIGSIGAPAVLIVVWALVVAPNADNRLPQPQRDLIGTGMLLLAAGALALAGQPRLAAAFAGLVIVNTALLFLFGHDAKAMGRQSR
jgi:Protein of unknown function (DUF2568)